MTHGIYDSDGSIRLTLSPGVGFVGLIAPDGSYYVTVAPDAGFVGAYAPDGSYYVTDATGSNVIGLRAPNGSLRVRTDNNNNGALKVNSSVFSFGFLCWGSPTEGLVWGSDYIYWS